MLLLFDRII